MKKLLLLFIFFTFSVNSQVLSNDDSTALIIGNIGTDLTGVTPGQNNWQTSIAATASPPGQNSDFQIVNVGGLYGNAIQIIGPSSTTGSRFMFKGGLPASWATRTVGNDIIEVEAEIFTGPATTSRNSFRIYLYSDETVTKPIAGIGVTKNATVTTSNGTVQTNYQNLVSGYAHYDNAGTIGFFSFGLGTVTPFQISTTDDTWLKVGFSFNKTTGEVKWKIPSLSISGFVIGAAAGLNPKEIDLIVATGNTAAVGVTFPAINNAASATVLFDNLLVKASSTDTLLGVNNNTLLSSQLSIFPNPSNGIVTILAPEMAINSIEMSDINGRIVKITKVNGLNETQINVSDLAKGVYFLKIASDKGIATKKLVVE